MFICQCHAVTDRQVTRAIDDGCASLAAVCQVTGAGTGCGQCIPTVRHIVAKACPMAAAMPVVAVGTPAGAAMNPAASADVA